MTLRSALCLSSLLGAVSLVALLHAPSAQGSPALAPPPASEPSYVMHEWGTFTSVAGQDGMALDWSPLDGPSDLPDFVYTPESPDGRRSFKPVGKTSGVIRMETPVIYFYADEALVVDVDVDFPSGRITEWYPRARQAGSGVRWGQVSVQPDATPTYPHDGSDSHYYPARQAEASPVKVCDPKGDEWEGYLFYRGVGHGELRMEVSLEGDAVDVREPKRSLGLLFERRGDAIGFTPIDGRGLAARPELNQSVEQVQAALRELLIEDGLYAAEADAMLATWEDDWFEEGLRLMWLLPDPQVEEMLPLTLDPPPAERVRTMVGRMEIITPEREARVREVLEKNADPAAALEVLRDSEGRFAEPTLRALLADDADDAQVAAVLALGWPEGEGR